MKDGIYIYIDKVIMGQSESLPVNPAELHAALTGLGGETKKGRPFGSRNKARRRRGRGTRLKSETALS